MGIKTDRVIVVDIEATCWETKEEQGFQPNEIIEIGICELFLKTGEIKRVSGYTVKPRVTEVSTFCEKLTGWTPEQVSKGADIAPTILKIESDYQLDDYTAWFSCGDFDRRKLASHGSGSLGQLYGIQRHENIFDRMRHFNIKQLFALKYQLPKEVGMERMLQIAGETLDGKHHCGADDAANIAKLVRKVLS